MAKRLTDTEKWKDDWYLSLSNDYKIIWQWLLDNCSHAGVCKRSINMLNMMCKTSVTEEELLEIMEGRVVVGQNIWFIPKFIKFQYNTLQSKKPVIVSVVKEIVRCNLVAMIPESFGNDYLIIPESLPNHSAMITQSLGNDSIIIKDKDKDKDLSFNTDSTGANEKKPFAFPGSPMPEDVTDPPERIITSIRERQYQLGNRAVTPDTVTAYWRSWLAMEANGEKFYSAAADVHTHFARHCSKSASIFPAPAPPPQGTKVSTWVYSERDEY